MVGISSNIIVFSSFSDSVRHCFCGFCYYFQLHCHIHSSTHMHTIFNANGTKKNMGFKIFTAKNCSAFFWMSPVFLYLSFWKWLDYTPNIVSLFVCVCTRLSVHLYALFGMVFQSINMTHAIWWSAFKPLSFSLPLFLFSVRSIFLALDLSRLHHEKWANYCVNIGDWLEKLGPNWIKPANRFVFTNKRTQQQEQKHFQFWIQINFSRGLFCTESRMG